MRPAVTLGATSRHSQVLSRTAAFDLHRAFGARSATSECQFQTFTADEIVTTKSVVGYALSASSSAFASFKKNFCWTCNKDTKEQAFNDGSVVAIMRITDLMT